MNSRRTTTERDSEKANQTSLGEEMRKCGSEADNEMEEAEREAEKDKNQALRSPAAGAWLHLGGLVAFIHLRVVSRHRRCATATHTQGSSVLAVTSVVLRPQAVVFVGAAAGLDYTSCLQAAKHMCSMPRGPPSSLCSRPVARPDAVIQFEAR